MSRCSSSTISVADVDGNGLLDLSVRLSDLGETPLLFEGRRQIVQTCTINGLSDTKNWIDR